ncbi:MAG: bifunctional diaminohydroxyphosphoribosylaminopyrimidine deaminase/5-amino-6-(5-phosphoribosylamino)uracil reductase RibD [Chitinivibrionales bacterium]|nr:bifunctional diaminohydroxyphosphoribosylaminopyrimidine deaminase/5-amino-6-(5-phosphoribosylamino)uracil reductase RibD [Chitinivibrionales bacterium]
MAEDDLYFMQVALHQAQMAKGTTFPNPAVGAVVVNDNHIIAAAATSSSGRPHAEVNALSQAGGYAHGATLYVTLEPCSHVGKSGPCCRAIAEAGISRVVVAVKDPNPLVDGKGIQFLKRHGIAVTVGCCQQEAAALNEDFFWSIKNQKPWVSLKLALSLDGRIADAAGGSRWISSKEARVYTHELRRRHAAIAVGGATLLKDNSKLTVRHVHGRDPCRIVFTSLLKVPETSAFLKTVKRIRSIIVSPGGKRGSREMNRQGIEIWRTGTIKKDQNLTCFLEMAYSEGLTSILVEGGSRLATSFLENGFVNKLYLFYGNKLFGNGINAFSFKKGLPCSQSISLDSFSAYQFGETILISGIPSRRI